MQVSANTRFTKKINIAFLVISFGIVQFLLNPSLIYHKQQPLFLFDFQIFLDSLLLPGGLIHYIAQFISGLYYIPILGSVIIILLIYLLVQLISNYLNNTALRNYSATAVPIVWVLSLCVFLSYNFNVEAYVMLIGAFLLITLINRIIISKGLSRFVMLLASIIFSLGYLFFGGFAALIMLIGIGCSVLKLKAANSLKYTFTGILSLLYILLPFLFVSTNWLVTPYTHAYLSELFFHKYLILPHVYFLLVLVVLLLLILPRFSDSIKGTLSAKLVGLIGLASIIVIPLLCIDKNGKAKITLDYWAANQQWNNILEIENEELFLLQSSAIQYNRALYNREELLSGKKIYKQKYGSDGLYMNPLIDNELLMVASDFYFDLGLITESRHWAHEAYTIYEKQPRILKRLAEVNIILGKYNTAEKYLSLLKKSLNYKKWAKDRLSLVYGDISLIDFPLLYDKRENLPLNDFFVNTKDIKETLLLLGESNVNRMPFEYLMAYYLYQHKIGEIINRISSFKSMGYFELPPMIQEAITLYVIKTKQYKLDLKGYKIDPEYISRFKEYNKLYKLAQKQNVEAKNRLETEYADSYWYYMQFVSPLK